MGCSSSKSTEAVTVANPAAATQSSASLSGGSGGSAASLITKRVEDGDTAVATALRAKRKGIVATQSVKTDPSYKAKHYAKTLEQEQLIFTALRENVLFATLGERECQELVKAMQPMAVSGGQQIIKQGDQGDYFYVVENGKYDIVVHGKKVAVFGEGTTNMSFGELALLYNSPRAATVQATTPGKLWRIERLTFRNVIANSAHQENEKIKSALRRGILEELDEDQLDKIAAAAEKIVFHMGDQVIRKGATGDVFYIIESGAVICKNLPGGQSNNVLQAGDYFGERALIKKEPRAADVFAHSETVSLVALHRDDFEALLGHLSELLEYNMGMRLLLCVPVLASLDSAARSELFGHLKLVDFSPGHQIVTEGRSASAFHIIKDGTVSITRTNADGVEEEVQRLSAGQWFGQKEVGEGTPAQASVKAATKVECFRLGAAAYRKFLQPMSGMLVSGGVRAASPASGRGGAAASGAGAKGGGPAAGTALSIGLKGETRKPLGIPFDELDQRATLGTGTFGRVRLVVSKRSGKTFALKMLQKAQIVALNQTKNIMNEKLILMTLDHPFVLRLFDTFKDPNRLYMLLELVQGGELFSRLQTSATPGRVSVGDARFYGACVLDAFDHMHLQNIIYRDLKPENLLIDCEGYIRVVDFGFAKIVKNRTYTLCGTPEYLAPELLVGKGHNKGVDYWALGVLLYEMVGGYSPFADHERGDQMVICKNILRGHVRFPSVINNSDLKEVIMRLLDKDITKRLGMLKGGAKDIKAHRFFRKINWTRMLAKREKAPWTPPISDPLDTSNFDPYDEDDHVQPYRDDGTHWDKHF